MITRERSTRPTKNNGHLKCEAAGSSDVLRRPLEGGIGIGAAESVWTIPYPSINTILLQLERLGDGVLESELLNLCLCALHGRIVTLREKLNHNLCNPRTLLDPKTARGYGRCAEANT